MTRAEVEAAIMAKPRASSKRLESAMREVHENVPRNVVATGKRGKSKEKMLAAIAYSKARRGK